MESLIQEDITDLLESFKELEGETFVPHRRFSTAVVRSLWNIIAGEKLKYGDPSFQSILDNIHRAISGTSITGPAFFMSWLVKLFPNWTGLTAFSTAINDTKKIISKYIEDHMHTFQEDNIRDYIDDYLKKIKATTDAQSSFHGTTGEKNLLVGILNLFGAGGESTSQTIVWTLLYLIKYPDVQEKLFQEIKSAIGLSRLPSLDDRDSCPYALAVMEESFRMSSFVPLGVFHNTMTDVTYKGYHIPKDTLVAANLYGVHHDKKVWGDPKTFRPERFLSEDKKKVISGPGPVIPFSIGKRACLGEVLARSSYFLYLTSLIQKFEFRSGEMGELRMEGSYGVTRSPKPFKILVQERAN